LILLWVKAEQKSPGRFDVPNWDQESQKQIREALKTLGATLPDLKHAGGKNEVDPVRHLIATAWGGNPDKDAIYLNISAPMNDGKTTYKLNVDRVPVDAFWSITVYNAEGHLQLNPLNRYNLNSITAQKDADGSITVQFGGCDGKAPNCLPIMSGWNYIVRLSPLRQSRRQLKKTTASPRFPSFLELGTAVATGIPTSSMFRRLCLSSDLGSDDFPGHNDFDAAILLATFARAVVCHRIAQT
jgi:Protein of unknown function (DUF1214)